jgi:hypothetical protein
VHAVHEKRKDHACPHCTAAFGLASNLRTHVRNVHEKRKDHACPHCAAAFGRASSLRVHVHAVHEKRKDHACLQCAAVFGRVSGLRAHVRAVHEKRRDHACPHCTAAFGHTSHLTKHVRTVHLAPHCAAAALVAGRGGEGEEQAEEADGDDLEPEWVGEGLVGLKIRIAYPDEDGEGSTYWPVTVNAFSADTKEHLVVGEGFESREDLRDCHWRFTSVTHSC